MIIYFYLRILKMRKYFELEKKTGVYDNIY